MVFARLDVLRRLGWGLLLTGLPLAAQPAPETVTVQLKWRHSFQFAGFYAAVEKGYYREAGLDVRLVEGDAETQFAEELTSGRCEFAVALSSMLLHRQQGQPVVALAAILQHSPEILLVLEASGINTPHQMAGRTVAVSPEDTPALLAMFKNEGLAPEAVKTVPYTLDIPRLQSGELAGMGAYSINEPFLFTQLGLPHRALQPRDYGVDFYGDCLYTTEAQLRQHPRRVRAFLDASLRGWKYAMSHTEEIIDLILARYPSRLQEPRSRDALRHEAEEMARLMFSDLIEIGHMNEGRWRHIGDTYVRLGMLPANYRLDGFLYDRHPKPALAWLWWTLGGTAASTLLLGGLVLVLVRINRRITRAEREACEARATLQTVLDTIPVGVFWTDRQARVLGCNRVYAAQLGLPSAEAARGRELASLRRGPDSAGEQATDRAVLDTGRAFLLQEQAWTAADGGVRHFCQSKVPLLQEDGTPAGLLGVLEDISPLKEAEQQQHELRDRLLVAQKYQSLHRLANGVCHRSNNILQALTSYAELAQMQAAPGPVRDCLDAVLRESQRVAALNRMLLTFTGHGEHRFEALTLRGFLEDALPTLRCCLPSAQQLEWDGNAADAVLSADRESLKLLLINLVTNAAEASPADAGSIRIRHRVQTCDRATLEQGRVSPPPAPGDYACIEVVDSGSGIPEDVQKLVFEPFFSTKFTGRGLGLAAALGIVQSHQGTIRILSRPGQGTTVQVFLPVQPAAPLGPAT